MIVSLVLGLVGGLFGALTSVIPLPSPPSWMDDTGPVASVFAGASHLGAWFPVSIVVTVILFVAGINVVGFSIKIARIAVSLFTGGGGSTG